MHELKIPKLRVACLIGKKGETKRIIERSTKTKVKISSEGDVEIEGESYGEYICEKIVKAVGRGFNPDIALNLVREGYGLEIIDIKDYVGKSKNKLIRLKARLIGSEGKARKIIERLTDCSLCVYGKTISIIGEVEKLNIALRGIQKLLQGSMHGNVFAFLEREMKKLKKDVQ